jgi:hypothetical protein
VNVPLKYEYRIFDLCNIKSRFGSRKKNYLQNINIKEAAV